MWGTAHGRWSEALEDWSCQNSARKWTAEVQVAAWISAKIGLVDVARAEADIAMTLIGLAFPEVEYSGISPKLWIIRVCRSCERWRQRACSRRHFLPLRLRTRKFPVRANKLIPRIIERLFDMGVLRAPSVGTHFATFPLAKVRVG